MVILDFILVKGMVKIFLGCLWGFYLIVVVMKFFIDDFIDLVGWVLWDIKDKGCLLILFYGEF